MSHHKKDREKNIYNNTAKFQVCGPNKREMANVWKTQQ